MTRDTRSPTRPFAAAALTLLAVEAAFVVVYCWPEASRPTSVETARSGRVASAGPHHAGPAFGAASPSDEAADAEPRVPVYHPRAEREWQGMRVDMSMRALCEGAKSCGLAAACLEHQCGPCDSDDQCGDGEVCVLDHCLIAENVQCRSRRDCPGSEALCVLSGYSSDPRGNGEMRAYCLEPKGGVALPTDLRLPEGLPAAPPPVDGSALLEAVQKHVGNLPERPGNGGK